uniref:Putative synaptojanin (N-terminal domain) n=1 Tax=Trypanosoma congolense (strain IL3000) TaxID=1068625 RepID=G0UPZ6_TRYCI|nr:putative synaptojanin (N-terminal domain) [Trypanosoma congolense IL3000]
MEDAPRKRCAVCVKDGQHIIFVVLPRQPPPQPEEPEPLMFFDKPSPRKEPKPVSSNRIEWRKWSAGSYCVPLVVGERGDIKRCTTLPRTEFPNLREVYRDCAPFESFLEFPALFGCLRLDKMYFLVAANVGEVAALPFGGAITRVFKTEWITVPIPGSGQLLLSSGDKNRLKEFEQYSFEKGYYYSDDCDMRRPFPFVPPPGDNAPRFHSDWSRYLRKPFTANGLEDACSVLFRGFAEGKEVFLKDGSSLHILLYGRQSNLNPGPRYFGRGLNEANAVGNDHVYEYVMWKHDIHRNHVLFTRHTLLRGTIPVRWSTHIGKTVSEPSMIFNPNKEEVLRGCDSYYSSVFTQLAAFINYDMEGRAMNVASRLRCVNMLRQSHHSSEEMLTKHYVEAVARSQPVVARLFPGSQLDLVHVDLLGLTKEKGTEGTTTIFWRTLFASFPSSHGEFVTVGTVDEHGKVTHSSCQTNFVRVNCADSLDRTNIGCFYTCFQATLPMTFSLGLDLESFADQRPLPPLEDQMKYDNSEDFMAQIHAWSQSPRDFVSTWQEGSNPLRFPVAIGRVLSELYVYNGDIIARLYTNSAAMHSNILRGVCGLKPATSNVVIATKRRYENVFEDKNKFRNIELLLGRNIDIHFPSMSRVFLQRPVPLDKWSCALLAVGVPSNIQCGEMEQSLRRAWDKWVVPKLKAQSLPLVSSEALTFAITTEEGDGEHHDEFLCAVKQLEFEQEQSVDEDVNVTQNNEHVAVIEFDEGFCRVLNAPLLLRENAILNFQSSGATFEPYTYPMAVGNDSPRGIVQKAANSFRSGVKNLMRGLNK